MTQQPKWDLVPEHLRGALNRYLTKGIRPGHFLTAVLENKLMEAMGLADENSRAGLFGLCQFLYCYTPGQCHGSPEKVLAWIAEGGLGAGKLLFEYEFGQLQEAINA